MKKTALISASLATVIPASMYFASVELQPTSPGTIQSGNINISGVAKAGAVVGYSSTPTGIAFGGDFRSVSDQGRGILGNASSPTGATYGGLFQAASNAGRAVAGIASATAGTTYGGFFSSASSIGRGVYGQATSASGLNFGVYGKSASPDGYGVYSDGNFLATGTIFGNGNGLINLKAGTLVGTIPSDSLPNVVARIDQENVFGEANRFSENVRMGSGVASPPADLSVNSVSNTGSGLVNVLNGTAPHGGFANGTYGVFSQAESTDIFCVGLLASGRATNGSAYGVFASSEGTGTFAYGIYSTVAGSTATNRYAGYFLGSLYATSANAGVKAFLIDHPLDPANKVLSHSSVESDERKNIYDGLVTTDSRGYATVTLPNWFGALNVDFRYQLTVVDSEDSESFTLAKVVREIGSDNRFKIRTSTPNAKVSWQVTGRRHDPTSEFYPLQVERYKRTGERGRYYAPEAFGKDKSMGLGGLETDRAGNGNGGSAKVQNRL